MSVFPEMLNFSFKSVSLHLLLPPWSDLSPCNFVANKWQQYILHCLKAACISFRYSGRDASDNNSLDKAIFYLNIDTFVG